jgi:hypothetical protein
MNKQIKHDSTKSSIPAINEIQALTRTAVDIQNRVEIAGFLTREDDNSVYVADPQGTWMVFRKDILFVEDWKAEGTPVNMHIAGRPVRIGIKDGSTIHEIRPWYITKGPMGGSQFRQAVEKIFTLGGTLPVGANTILGENRLAGLERAFARRLGWDPDDPRTDPRGEMRLSAASATYVLNDGYCDTDCAF